MATGKSEALKAHCNQCRQTTNHRVLMCRVHTGSDDEQGFSWKTEYSMLECCGCDEVMLKRVHYFSEDPDASVSFFPPPASRWVPKWRWKLPIPIAKLIGEVYTALQADGLSLAMMGARAIIETAMVKKVGASGFLVGAGPGWLAGGPAPAGDGQDSRGFSHRSLVIPR